MEKILETAEPEVHGIPSNQFSVYWIPINSSNSNADPNQPKRSFSDPDSWQIEVRDKIETLFLWMIAAICVVIVLSGFVVFFCTQKARRETNQVKKQVETKIELSRLQQIALFEALELLSDPQKTPNENVDYQDPKKWPLFGIQE